MLKKYKIALDLWGLALFCAIMVPTFIWAVVPAPNDILRNTSATVQLDRFSSVCQVVMAVTLCMLVNRTYKKSRLTSLYIVLSLFFCPLYFGTWSLYYAGKTEPWVILALCIFPCIAFLFYALARKNAIATLFVILFSICHLMHGVLNFII